MRLSRGGWLLLLFLAASCAWVGYSGLGLMDKYYHLPGDFGVFYTAGKQVASGDRALLYSREDGGLNGSGSQGVAGSFFNPPLLAYLFTPLTLLTLTKAKAMLTAFSLIAMMLVLLISERWSRRSIDMIFAGLAVISFWPLYTALHLGQPSALFALIAAASFAALQDSRWQTAGWLGSLLVLKPSIAPLQMAVLALQGRRSTLVALVAGALLLGLAPFLLLGGHAFADYLDLLSASRRDSFQLLGHVSSGAVFMCNWNGFFARLAAKTPDARLIILMDAVTLALLAKVLLKRDLIEGWLAAALATNLAVPHLIYYDLLLLLAPAFALAMTRRDPVLIGALVLAHLSINLSMAQIYHNGFTFGHRSGYAFIAASPAMLLVLTLLAFDGLREWIGRRLRLGSPVPPTRLQAAPA